MVAVPETDFVAGELFGAVGVGDAGGVVGVETFGVVGVVNGEDTVFDGNTFAGEGDDAFYDILVANTGGGLAGEDIAVAAVGENYDLTAFGNVLLPEEVGDGNGDTIDDNPVVGVEGVFHAGADDIVATKDKSVEEDCADDDGTDEGEEAKGVF